MCTPIASIYMKSSNNGEPEKYPYKIAGMIWGDKIYRCSWCGGVVEGFRDRLSCKEFRISGLCQPCQDKMFGKEEQ